MMSLQSLAKQFVEWCNQGRNFEVMETMYAPDIVSVEASGVEVVGQVPVIEKSKRWAGANTIHGGKVLGPYFDRLGKDGAPPPDSTGKSTGQFAVHFSFDVTPKATGQRTTLDEVGIYTVKDGKITREQFFYEGSR
jgi:hypothetical protein